MNGECKFCGWLAYLKEVDERQKEIYRRERDKPIYTVALVHGCKKSRGQTSYHGYELNFCPECGKELKP